MSINQINLLQYWSQQYFLQNIEIRTIVSDKINGGLAKIAHQMISQRWIPKAVNEALRKILMQYKHILTTDAI